MNIESAPESEAELSAQQGMLREEIALSWRRSMLSGLRPDDTFDAASIEETDRRSRLFDAATPILDRMQDDLADTRYCVLLADRDARLIDLRVGQRRIQDRIEEDGAIRGRVFTEENTGTNSIATVYETRQPLAVRGEEHFVEAMKKYSCYGYPITHPTTRRLEGVLDVTFLSEDDSPLLRPMLTRAVEDVHRRLLEGARSTEIALLAAFQETVSRRRGAPVVAIGEDVFFANTAAQQVLDSVDHTVLRAVTEGTPSGRQLTKDLTLNSGLAVRAIWSRVTSRGGVVLEFDPAEPLRHRHSVVDRREVKTTLTRTIDEKISAAGYLRLSTLITGDPGTGKSRALTALAGDTALVRHCATILTERPADRWIEDLSQSLDTHDGLVAVEDFHLLPPAMARRVGDLLTDSGAWWAISSGPLSTEMAEHQRILLHCSTQITLASLRSRTEEIPHIARVILREIGADDSVRLTAGAIDALTRHSWPGNISELKRMLEAAVQRHSTGDITADQLPVLTSGPWRELSPLQRAEYEAIERELDRSGGNKRAAAKALGISRTTLYKRMNELGIVA
ncbi:sigma-54-dependent Fis family transcriptional regulator [Rhodococcus pyridinivorans]|uniref:sigma-54-dependent Fis family transcriptional regulator n=1 Tax=Rhodococcus pyridinivorans TaxID=103816 RepID=UPI0019051F04|nr:helix-turn-helix domain-containing protein [Rhodococcus pyridinivorans]QQM52978.1 transcriptional regulator [Rhodococcus pyridinivorans]